VRNHEALRDAGVGGALYIEDFRRMCTRVGFADPRQLSAESVVVTSPAVRPLVGDASFHTIVYRCFKLDSLETLCEDYGAWCLVYECSN
jgi:hypothetical protein